MAIPILTTKLFLPRARAQVIARPQLTSQLHQGLDSPVTLISAPAGFGKTTLVSEWHATLGRDLPLAWLSLDGEDNDPRRFLTYVMGALATLSPSLEAEGVACLQGQLERPMTELDVARFGDALAHVLSVYPSRFVLALDDYHVLTNRSVHTAMGRLLDQHLQPLRLVLLTRSDPPLPLARLRARGELTEIRSAELSFSVDEASCLLNDQMRLGLSADDVRTLAGRTEGWAAGLQLAALSLKGRAGPSEFVARFSGDHHYILDYLAGEVLEHLPDAVRVFLLKTSILDELSAPLCEAVTGEPDAQSQIEAVEQANLFITPLDDQRTWYRYHPLFADVLRNRLHLGFAGQTADLHLRASDWYARQGRPDAAIRHALAGEHWECAAALMDAASEIAFDQGDVARLLAWVRALPAGMIYAAPRLCHYYAWAVAVAEAFDESDRFLAVTGDRLKAANAKSADLLAQIDATNGPRKLVRLVAYAQQALETPTGLIPGSLSLLRLARIFTFWWLGDAQAAATALQDSIHQAEQSGRMPELAISLGFLARLQIMQGHLEQALSTFHRVLAGPEDLDTALGVGQAMAGLAAVHYERNELGPALEWAQRCRTHGQQTGHADIQVSGLRLMARTHQALGQSAVADADLTCAELVIEDQGLPQVARESLAATRAQIALAQGDLEAAGRWLEHVRGEAGANLQLASIPLERAKLALARGDRLLAAALLAERFAQAERNGARYAQLEIRILQALAADRHEALEYLGEALAWGEPEGFVRVFVDQGSALAPLLRDAAQMGMARSYVGRLLPHFSKTEDPNRAASQQLIEPLTARELEILQLLVVGKSNRAIAKELFVTTGTVKKHLNNVFGKLDVQNRTECAARANELGLTQAPQANRR